MNAQLQSVDNWSGVFPDIPDNTYHQRSLDIASASGLKQVLRSPAHFRHWVRNPEDDKESPALTFGRALHMAILQPDVFIRTYAVVEANAPKYPTSAQWNAKKSSPESDAAKAWWREWEVNNAGRIRLSLADYDRARFMADSARAHPVAAGLIVGGDREITFRWEDPVTNLKCQARADLYAAGEFLMDIKTCRDASSEAFARAVASYLYDVQEAHYVEGIRANGDAIRWFVFLAIESEAPYACNPCFLDAKANERGWALRQRAITRQAQCLQAGRWPAYGDGLTEIHLPTWAHYLTEEPTA